MNATEYSKVLIIPDSSKSSKINHFFLSSSTFFLKLPVCVRLSVVDVGSLMWASLFFVAVVQARGTSNSRIVSMAWQLTIIC